ncbi:MAG: segregation and condensation protein A [Solirubrobacteraceae bacterium]
MRLIDLELDLDVFAGPFDLLLTLILREEVDLLEVDLAEIVISYVDHLEEQDDSRAARSSEAGCLARGGREGELELEAATEFLVLIAALLELKSRLMLPGEEDGVEQIDLDPGEAADELLRRLLDAHRYRAASAHLRERLAAQAGYRFRVAPLPQWLRRASLQEARAVYDPSLLASAVGGMLRMPEPVDVRHIGAPKVSVAARLAHLRQLLRRGAFSFEEAVAQADRVTVAVTLFAVLELYKQGELTWSQRKPFGEIRIEALPVEAQAPKLIAAG